MYRKEKMGINIYRNQNIKGLGPNQNRYYLENFKDTYSIRLSKHVSK